MLTCVVGTYTDGTSKGIYSLRFDQETGKYELLDSIQAENPSYVILNGKKDRLYAVSELHNDKAALLALEFDKSQGKFKLINSQLTHGMDPCHLVLGNGFVATANYSSGSITVFPLDEKGGLKEASQVIKFEGTGPDKSRQEMSHAHHVYFTPDKQYLLVNDLGTDQIHKFKVNPTIPYLSETHEDIAVDSMSGPRHSAFSHDGKFMYLINELNGYVYTFKNENNKFTKIQGILADKAHARGSADIHISPDGKFLYSSNRLKEDGVAIFKINVDGTLEEKGYQLTGIHPRMFNITPNGKYILVTCRDSDSIEIYKRDFETGLISKQDEIKYSHPVCIQFIE